MTLSLRDPSGQICIVNERVLRVVNTAGLSDLHAFLASDVSAEFVESASPDQVGQASFYSGDEWRRNLVKPGITGLAQVSGRNAILWAERKQLDLEYVARQSVLLDLEILLRTVPCVLTSRGIFVNQISEKVR